MKPGLNKKPLALIVLVSLALALLLSGCAQSPSSGESNAPNDAILSKRFDGVYISTDGAEQRAVSIRSIVGLLLIENSLAVDGSVYSFWAQELRPEDVSTLYDSSLESVQGVCYEFSTISNNGEYWDATAKMTVKLTDDGVCLTKRLDDYIVEETCFAHTDKDGYFHTDTQTLYEVLSQSFTLAENTVPAGNWSLRGENFAAWLSFTPDRGFHYALKIKETPVFFLSGAWGVDTDGNLQIIAEQFGGGTMPLEYTLRLKSAQNGLILEALNDLSFLPLEGENIFFAEKQGDIMALSSKAFYP